MSRSKRRRHPLLLGLAFLMIVGSVGLAVPTASFVATARRAEGTVGAVGDLSLLDRGRSVRIAFRDVRGTVHRFDTSTLVPATGPRELGYSVGGAVPVLYQRNDPAGTARVARPLVLWQWPAALALAGLLTYAIARVLSRNSRTAR